MKRKLPAFGMVLMLVLFSGRLPAQDLEIRILHVNDFHGFAEPHLPFGAKEPVGGIAFLADKIESLRREKPSLLLSAGDMIQGNNWANLFQGQSVMELMNAMKFDAMTLGNHEFDFGREVLSRRIAEATFPVLGANIEGFGGIKPFMIRELQGLKIAIIGLVTEDVPVATHPKNVAGLQFLSPVDTARSYLSKLREKADLIVILSHIGHPADRILAEKISGIDLVVGGHSHTKVEEPVHVGQTVIVQAWENGKALGVVDLSVKGGRVVGIGGRLEEISPKASREHPNVSMIVEKYGKRVEALLNQRVGESETDLDGERGVRKAETNLGSFIADVMRNVSGADATIINGGGIRASIRKGEIRVKDIYTALPFDNYIVAIKLTGRGIMNALEHGVSAVEEGEGRFPQISGIRFKYSPRSLRGSRVKEILVSGQPIDPEREYSVATNDFLAAGGDGYKAFGEAIRRSKDLSIVGGMMKGEKIVYSDAGRWLRDVIVEYVRGMGRIAPQAQGRIIEVP